MTQARTNTFLPRLGREALGLGAFGSSTALLKWPHAPWSIDFGSSLGLVFLPLALITN